MSHNTKPSRFRVWLSGLGSEEVEIEIDPTKAITIPRGHQQKDTSPPVGDRVIAGWSDELPDGIIHRGRAKAKQGRRQRRKRIQEYEEHLDSTQYDYMGRPRR